MIIITGGSGSGKSAYAENRITELANGQMPVYYLATMQVYGEEGRQRVEKHRRQREGKGFLTIEQPRSIADALQVMVPGNKAVLLECMSNLVANEMFAAEIPADMESVHNKIIAGIQALRKECENLVIVTNNVFEDGEFYDDTTMEYIRTLGSVNASFAELADEVWEVVVGIPVLLKERR